MTSDAHERRGKLSTGPESPSASSFLELEYVRSVSTLQRPLFREGKAGRGIRGAWALPSQSAADVGAGTREGLKMPCPPPHSFQGSGEKGGGREIALPAFSAH